VHCSFLAAKAEAEVVVKELMQMQATLEGFYVVGFRSCALPFLGGRVVLFFFLWLLGCRLVSLDGRRAFWWLVGKGFWDVCFGVDGRRVRSRRESRDYGETVGRRLGPGYYSWLSEFFFY